MSDGRKQVVTGTIPAAPDAVFAVLADPARHTEIDGAGMLRGAPSESKPMSAVGDSFDMNMDQDPFGTYVMRNEILAFEPGRRIAWAPGIHPSIDLGEMLTKAGAPGDIDFSGYFYAWDLEPAAGGGTAVTHTCDWNGVRDERAVAFFPRVTAEQMAESIARLGRSV